jgi:hypothetical protein
MLKLILKIKPKNIPFWQVEASKKVYIRCAKLGYFSKNCFVLGNDRD